MASRPVKSLSYDAYTVAMICPLEVEMSAARYMLSEEHGKIPGERHDTNHYILGRLSGHNVVIASLPLGSQGTVSAATVAMHLARTFPNIKLRLLVGIAGGVPSPNNDIRLGDVVVSTPSGSFGGVVEYDLGKQTPSGFVRKGFLSPPPTEWRGAIARMKSDHRVHSNKVNDFVAEMLVKFTRLAEYKRPHPQEDILFSSDYEHKVGESTCLSCDPAKIVHREARDISYEPVVFYGLIASGNHVMKHAIERDRISMDCDGVLCFEMEAAGLMNDFPCIVIRGISDYCDSHKNDGWQPYAAAAAAGIAKELLGYLVPSNVPLADDDLTAACLRHLFITDPEKDKQRIEGDRGNLLRDCYSWILFDPQLNAWREAEQGQLLWIRGGPGKGKTMLMIGLVHEITVHLECQPEAGILTYFFCQRNLFTLNNALSILRGLIWMIVDQDRPLMRHILVEYERFGERLFDGPNAFFALRSIFLNILEDAGLSTLYILVDAIDECDTGLDNFLHLVVQSTSALSSKVKWILTSRHRPDITQILGENALQHHIDMEANARLVSEAVHTFIAYKMDILSQAKSYDPGLKTHVERVLREKAGDTFLWVALVCNELTSAESWEAESIVEELPSGLHPLYNHMLSQIKNLRKGQSEICYRILRSMTLTFRPVYLEELQSITFLPPRLANNIQALRNTIELCGSFLTIQGNQIYFIHQSAKDYLTTSCGQQIYDANKTEEHCKIVVQSMKTMSQVLKKDLAGLKYPGTLISNLPASRIPSGIAYAVCFWIHHLLEFMSSSCNSEGAGDLLVSVHAFLQSHLLHWIEAMSLLGKVSDGLLMITQFKSCLKVFMDKGLFHFIHDANRFLLQSRSVIEEAPLQVYCSALVFAPEKSIIRNQFKHYMPDWIRRVSTVREDWSSLIQTFEGHSGWVNDVVFSVKGDLIASASNDHTVRLWDVTTGSAQASLEGHTDLVKTVAYSPNGHLLASGSNDRTIRLWNPNTGATCGILRGHTSPINSIAFSPDKVHLASASNDRSVRIWNTARMSSRHVLWGHKNWVNDVCYSSDGCVLATASGDGTVRLWDAESGNLRSKFRGGMGWLNSVSLSHDNILAAGSANGLLYLWDISTKSLCATLGGHSSSINKVTFSLDGRLIASVSNDRMVRLWQTAQPHAVATLEGHIDAVKAVTFSPNENLIASASVDGTVRIWDTVKTSSFRILERHMDTIYGVAVSPNGQLTASISNDNTVRLWDMLTGSPLTVMHRGHCDNSPGAAWSSNIAFSSNGQLLVGTWDDSAICRWRASREGIENWAYSGWEEGKVYPVTHVSFSPDNRLIASLSSDGIVRIWDVASGWTRTTFAGHQEAVNDLKFSPCSQYVASASKDSCICLWEATTGALIARFAGHRASVNAVAFSSDGQHIVSGSTDNKVRIWNVAAKQVQTILKGHSASVERVAYFDGDRLVSSISAGGRVIIWCVATSSVEKDIPSPQHGQNFFSLNCQFYACSCQPHPGLHLHDMMAGSRRYYETPFDISGNFAYVKFVSFSRDNEVMALILSDDTIHLRSTTTSQRYCTINMSQTKVSRDSRVDDLSRLDPGPQATTISMVEFSPHSDHFLCVSRNSVYVWDVVTGGLRSTFSGHSDIVKNISFSPDGHLIASASYDGTIRLWDIATGMLHHMMVVNGSSHGVFYGNGLFDSPVVCRSGVRQLGFRRSGVRRSGVGGIGTDSAWAPIRRRSLFVTNPWITYRMDRILWLPVEYRATCVTVHVATLVLGHSSGELTVIEFDVSRIPVRAS